MIEQLKKVFPGGTTSIREAIGSIDGMYIKNKPGDENESLYYRGNWYSRDKNRGSSNKYGIFSYEVQDPHSVIQEEKEYSELEVLQKYIPMRETGVTHIIYNSDNNRK